ncbi:MAG: hypothetical protein ACK4IX_08875, partial [Candidatus Sericytochromatia bacterium]
FPILINDSVPIISEDFRIDFGPGTKGITYFGPGTKGVSGFGPGSKGVSEFGPGSKGVAEFGPGSKGISNLRFNINFSDTLTNNFNIQNFAIKNSLPEEFALNKLNLIVKKGEVQVAKIQTIPTSNNITFTLDLQTETNSDTYEVLAQADNTFDVLEEKAFVKLESNTEIKVTLYAQEKRREDLDIAIRTKPIKSRIQ